MITIGLLESILFGTFQHWVYTLVSRAGYDTEDIVQECYMELWKKKKELQSNSFIKFHVRNTLVNLLRHEFGRDFGRTSSWVTKGFIRKGAVKLAAAHTSYEEHEEWDPGCGRSSLIETQIAVQEAMRVLSARQQLFLLLYYWQGIPMLEIGQIIGVSEGLVSAELHKARQAMRLQLI